MNRISQKLGYHFEVPVFQVDDNNVIAVYDVTREANRNCRSGKDPVFIEFLTYQLRGHLGPDNNIHGSHTDTRANKEIEE